ncbi:unnamed protein product [marine sediment metagenome]|uniref:Uncharacterized protein n=1 Tax=marine sediment metagenome TaxID=412755 RepID=X1JZP9_9ZZZZ
MLTRVIVDINNKLRDYYMTAGHPLIRKGYDKKTHPDSTVPLLRVQLRNINEGGQLAVFKLKEALKGEYEKEEYW